MTNQYNHLVCVRCYTYQQASYIKDALDGFCMQQTNFPYLCIVVDDASTDGELDVINQYLTEHFDLEDKSISWTRDAEEGVYTYAQHKTNKNCFILSLNLKKNLYRQKGAKLKLIAEWNEDCKYQALCEGDDYWTDPLKLQKQVDFLESHPAYSMCFHGAEVLNETSASVYLHATNLVNREYVVSDVMNDWIVPTASILYNVEAINSVTIKHKEWLTRGDMVLVLRALRSGKLWGMSDIMSVYRMQEKGVSKDPEILAKERFKLPNYFKCLYINFGDLDTDGVIKGQLSAAYYSRAKVQRNVFKCIADMICSLYWGPSIFLNKVTSALKRML